MRKGLEMEFCWRAPTLSSSSQWTGMNNDIKDMMLVDWILESYFLPGMDHLGWRKKNNNRIWFFDGSSFYTETSGKHPEYDTPECDHVKTVVLYAERGVKLVADLLRQTNQRIIQEHGAVKPLMLFRANRDSQDNFCSEQENYEINHGLFQVLLHSPEDLRARIWYTFILATIPLWGSGDLLFSQKTGYISYSFSQRILKFFFKQASNYNTFTDFIVCLTKTQAETIPNGNVRLQLSRDATPSQYATFLKMGTAAILLKALTKSYLDLPYFGTPWSEKTNDLSLAFIKLAQEISQDTEIKNRWIIQGNAMTIPEINRLFCERLYAFCSSEGMSEEERLLFQIWEEAIEDLERWRNNPIRMQDHPRLSRRMDWAIKRRLIERVLEKHGFCWKEIFGSESQLDSNSKSRLFPYLAAINTHYHNILPETALPGAANLLQERDALFSEEEIAHNSDPPSHTARKRIMTLRAIKAMEKKENPPYWKEIIMDWGLCKIERVRPGTFITDSGKIIWDNETAELTLDEKAFLQCIVGSDPTLQ